MFEVTVEQTFAAAHFLRNYKGKCERLHGHNYKVKVTLEGDTLDEAGMLMDFTDIKRELKNATEYLDHQHLNEMSPFDVVNPSAENLAKYFYEQMAKCVQETRPNGDVRVAVVKVWETDIQYAAYRERLRS